MLLPCRLQKRKSFCRLMAGIIRSYVFLPDIGMKIQIIAIWKNMLSDSRNCLTIKYF